LDKRKKTSRVICGALFLCLCDACCTCCVCCATRWASWNVGKYHDNHLPAKFSSRKICENYLHTYTTDVYTLTFCWLHDVGCLHFWNHSAISPIFT